MFTQDARTTRAADGGGPAANGIELLSIPGSELGRGGARCMTCVVQRDGI